jgi:NADPH:quinone reductase-like Zn-dependent oxidoreductase
MRAAAIDRFGSPSVLKIHPLPVPTPGPNEILIALYSAGVGIWDTEMRQGWWPQGKPRFPVILGTDGAGIVAAKGSRVRRFATGDRVWAYEFINPKGGFYSEFVAVDARHAGPIPRNLDLLHAGASAVTGLTAFQGVHDHLRVRPGESVLVFGASGAVGSLAVQFAKHQGGRVIGMARGRDAAALLRKLGADVAIDAASHDAVGQLRAAAPEGVDAVLALAGGDTLEASLGLVRPGGRVVYPNGVEPAPRHRRQLRLKSYDAKGGPRQLASLKQAAEKTGLKVPLGGVYPLDQAAQAHERLEEGHVLGRIALRLRR